MVDFFNNREDALMLCDEIVNKIKDTMVIAEQVGNLPCLNRDEGDFGTVWKALFSNINQLCNLLDVAIKCQVMDDQGYASDDIKNKVTETLGSVFAAVEEQPKLMSREETLSTISELIDELNDLPGEGEEK